MTKIPEEYNAIGFDYGFSGVDEPPTLQTASPQQDTAKLEEQLAELRSLIETGQQATINAKYEADIKALEAIIIPLLNNLLKTADKDYIFWPNRKPIIEQEIAKVLKITRG